MTIDEQKIRQELSNLPENFIVLLLTDALSHVETNNFILKYLLQEKQMHGIYVTVNRTAKTVIDNVESMGMDPNKLFFIDCAVNLAKERHEPVQNILKIDSPGDLSDIGVALTESLKKTPEKNGFLLLDSISTLLLFNNAKSVVKFCHFFVNLIRDSGLKGVILAIDKETDEFVKRNLYVLSDRAITI
jgi:KaiC/GvpD/RAD55 family RecA-like ATPase